MTTSPFLNYLFAQSIHYNDLLLDVYSNKFEAFEEFNDSVYSFRMTCKGNFVFVLPTTTNQYSSNTTPKVFSKTKKELCNSELRTKYVPLIKLHGNVIYNFNYRSYLDTPFLQNDLMQHYVQTRLNISVKDKYNFVVNFNSRQSNSPYFMNSTDVSFQFNRNIVIENFKSKLKREVDQKLSNPILSLNPSSYYSNEKRLDLGKSYYKENQKYFDSSVSSGGNFSNLNKSYEEYKKQIDSLKMMGRFIKIPTVGQDLVENKEEMIRKKHFDSSNIGNSTTSGDYLTPKDTISICKADSITEKEKREYALRLQKVKDAESKMIALQKHTIDSLLVLKKDISSIYNSQTLEEYLHKDSANFGSNRLSSIDRVLLSIRQIDIGRSWIDYTDLTVKNISLNGVNIELNPRKIYVAGALGKINYRFRDFILQNDKSESSQNLALIRIGYGVKEKNSLIFTYYTGQKAQLNQINTKDSNLIKNISGFSIEKKVIINKNNYFIAEIAKSISNNDHENQLSNDKNEAFSIKSFNEFSCINLKVTSFYRKTGENFQSFTLISSSSQQEAWMIKLNKAFDKKRILLEASIKKNDFVNTGLLSNYSSSTIFKTIQITIKYPRCPLVILGFYPTSQLNLNNNKILYESQYNTFNGIVNYGYKIKNNSMNSNLSFTRFYNNSNDTGFLYYNASTITFQQTVYMGNFTLQGIYTKTEQTNFHQSTFEPFVTYQYKNILSLSGGLKYSKVNFVQTLWGGTLGVGINIKKVGVLQLQYEKTYLPSFNQTLKNVDLGRATYIKEF